MTKIKIIEKFILDLEIWAVENNLYFTSNLSYLGLEIGIYPPEELKTRHIISWEQLNQSKDLKSFLSLKKKRFLEAWLRQQT